MEMSRRLRAILTLFIAGLLASCGGTARPVEAPTSPSPAPTTPATAPAATAPATTATATTAPTPSGALSFTVATGSKATVRVREQLANFPAPSDAVLETSSVNGSFILNPDGTFASGSKIDVDLRTISSDSGQRDGYLHRTTLQTSRFPTAVFVPTATRGLALPLADGDFKAVVVGTMTIRGVTKDVTFDVSGTKRDGQITASATNAPTWKFADFGLEIPRVFTVLSIVDEIRLEVSLVANAG